MLSSRRTLSHRSTPVRALGPLALAVFLACSGPDDASRSEPRGGRETDDAAEWAAARRTDNADVDGDAQIADGAPLDDDAPADQAHGAERFPCTVIDQTGVEELLGNTVEEPSWTLEEVNDESLSFDAETCSWLSFAGDAGEIILQVSRGQHFSDGRIRCWTPASGDAESETGPDEDGVEPEPAPVAVADLGSTAWWIYDRGTAFGHLQVCHPKGRIAVEVNSGDGARARRAAVELARRAIYRMVDSG